MMIHQMVQIELNLDCLVTELPPMCYRRMHNYKTGDKANSKEDLLYENLP